MFLIDNTKIQNSKIIDVKNRHYADLDFQFSTGFENDSSNFKLLLNNVENTLYGFTNQGNITFAKVDFSFVTKDIQTVPIEIHKDGVKILEDSIEVTAEVTGGSGESEKIVCEVVAIKTTFPYDIDKVTSVQNPEKTENAKNFIFKNCKIDTAKMTSAKGLFCGVTDLEEMPEVNISNCTNLQGFAQSCTQLKTVPMLDTSNAENMEAFFSGCAALETVPCFNTSKVTNFKNAFYYCKALTSVPALNLENATTLYAAFDNCVSLTSVPDFDTKNCTDFTNVFQYCSKLEKAPKMEWGKATVCSYAFRNCTALTEVPVMNTSVCNKFNYVFYGCNKLQKIEKINLSSATDLSSAFGSCFALTSIDFEGEIPISVSFSSSAKLEASQLVNIMEHLKNLTGSSSQTLTLGSANLAKLSDSEKAIALNKNWILA